MLKQDEVGLLLNVGNNIYTSVCDNTAINFKFMEITNPLPYPYMEIPTTRSETHSSTNSGAVAAGKPFNWKGTFVYNYC